MISSSRPSGGSRNTMPSGPPMWSSRRITIERRSRSLRPGRAPSDTFIGVEQLAIFIECETIGHPGDVVGDDSRHRLAVALAAGEHVLGHLARVVHVGLEQAREHPARFAGHPADAVVAIEAVAPDLLEGLDLRAHRGTEADQR